MGAEAFVSAIPHQAKHRLCARSSSLGGYESSWALTVLHAAIKMRREKKKGLSWNVGDSTAATQH